MPFLSGQKSEVKCSPTHLYTVGCWVDLEKKYTIKVFVHGNFSHIPNMTVEHGLVLPPVTSQGHWPKMWRLEPKRSRHFSEMAEKKTSVGKTIWPTFWPTLLMHPSTKKWKGYYLSIGRFIYCCLCTWIVKMSRWPQQCANDSTSWSFQTKKTYVIFHKKKHSHSKLIL